MATNPGQVPSYADIDIRLGSRQALGYSIEVAFDGISHGYGYLPLDLVPWVASADSKADGERLFQLFSADDRLKADWAAVWGHSPRRRIRIGIDADAPELNAVPWELLCESTSGRTPLILSANEDTPFSRYLPSRWNPVHSPIQRPVRLIVAIANPEGLDQYGLVAIDREAEQAVIGTAIAPIASKDLAVSFVEQPVTLEAIEAEMRKGCDILQVLAHGAFNQTDGEAVLFLADAENHVSLVRDGDLAEMLARQDELPALVFLTSCQSDTRSSSDAFRGFAPRLVEAGVPAVLAMQGQVSLETAHKLTAVFYSRLLLHGRVDLAANQARSILISSGDQSGWGIPVLYSQAPSDAIIAPRLVPQSPLERVRQKPGVGRVLAVGSVLVALLSFVALVLGLGSDACDWLGRFGYAPAVCQSSEGTPAVGFRVGVAEFQMLRGPGQRQCATDGKELSNWLAALVDKNGQAQAPGYVPYSVLGPREIGKVSGVNPAERDKNAEMLAARHRLTVLIYGSISVGPDNSCQVEPAFYITPKEFDYAREVIGANRLGATVPFESDLGDPTELEGVNRQLNGRALALQHIIIGLNDLYAGNYGAASDEFEEAAVVPGWEDEEGKEVVHLLRGATELRRYNAARDPASRLQALTSANNAFARARQINQNYARSYLGLAIVAFQQAQADAPRSDAEKLNEARQYYEAARSASDQPTSAYIPIKADFGLGQVYLAGAQQGIPLYSLDEAQTYLNRVTKDAARGDSMDVQWYAAAAEAELGRISRARQDWQTMDEHYREAIKRFDQLDDRSLQANIASYWAQVGVAEGYLSEEGNNQLDRQRACIAFRRAIELGEGKVEPTELDTWRQAMEALKPEGAQGCL